MATLDYFGGGAKLGQGWAIAWDWLVVGDAHPTTGHKWALRFPPDDCIYLRALVSLDCKRRRFMNSLTVKNFTALSLGVVGATVVGLGLGATPTEAATVFTNEADFLANVQPGSYLEDFNALPTATDLGSSLPFSQNGFNYTANTTTTLGALK
jgi:hypothetical protein